MNEKKEGRNEGGSGFSRRETSSNVMERSSKSGKRDKNRHKIIKSKICWQNHEQDMFK